MQLKKLTQTDDEKLQDRIYAAMETGNQGAARTLLDEYAYVNPKKAGQIRASLVAEYGVAL